MRHDPASAAVVVILKALKMYGMAQAVGDLIEQGEVLGIALRAGVEQNLVDHSPADLKLATRDAHRGVYCAGIDYFRKPDVPRVSDQRVDCLGREVAAVDFEAFVIK